MASNTSEILKTSGEPSPSLAGSDSPSLLRGSPSSAAHGSLSSATNDNHSFPRDKFTLKAAHDAVHTLQRASLPQKMEQNYHLIPPADPCSRMDEPANPQPPEGLQIVLGYSIVEEPKPLFPSTTTLPYSQMQGLALSNHNNNMTPNCKNADRSFKREVKACEVEPWPAAAAAEKQSMQRCPDAAAAGFDAASLSPAPQLEDSIGSAFAEALKQQIPFLVSELPELKLSVEQLARFVCCLAGQQPTSGGAAPLRELAALFLACE